MHVELTREYRFDAAHRLSQLPEGHRCRALHGHGFRVEIVVAGEVDEATGFLIDYGEIDAHVKPLIEQLDHHLLNDVPGLEAPTSERLAAWLWGHLRPALPILVAVVIHESPRSRCTYRGG